MAPIVITAFKGENRAIHPTLLPMGLSVKAINQKPGRGDFRTWGAPVTVATVPGGRNSFYRMGRDVASDTLYWLSWTGIVHAVRGFNASDTAERTYYTGDGTPKWTDNIKALASAPYPTAYRELGVPAPAAACLLSATGGVSTTIVTRRVAYTFVTVNDEESMNSPPSAIITCKLDDIITIGSFAAVPSGAYDIDRIRVYITETGSTGSAFYFLREISATDLETTDDGRDRGEPMPSVTWAMPPADLKFLTAMWNGMLAGISGREVRVCEAYTVYAWPTKYTVKPPDTKPVALVTFGQNLVILTTGKPALVTGSTPDALDEQPIEFEQACIAPLSAVGMGNGVVWASPDGLCFMGTGGARVLTGPDPSSGRPGIMTRDDWQAIKPETIRASLYEGRYIATYTLPGSVRKGFIWDPQYPDGLFFLDFGWDALYFDDVQDALFLLDGVNIKRWDAGSALAGTYRSPLIRLGSPTPAYSCAQVTADAYPVTLICDYVEMESPAVAVMLAANPLFTSPNATTLRYTVTVASSKIFRIPSGFSVEAFQVEFVASGPVQKVAFAHSYEELETKT